MPMVHLRHGRDGPLTTPTNVRVISNTVLLDAAPPIDHGQAESACRPLPIPTQSSSPDRSLSSESFPHADEVSGILAAIDGHGAADAQRSRIGRGDKSMSVSLIWTLDVDPERIEEARELVAERREQVQRHSCRDLSVHLATEGELAGTRAIAIEEFDTQADLEAFLTT